LVERARRLLLQISVRGRAVRKPRGERRQALAGRVPVEK
jgi:hypothetical protein